MLIEALELIHYRNYDHELILFEQGVNIILGNNAQGKTNLIESLFFLSRGYSHRASNLSELVSWDKEDFSIRAQVMRFDVRHQIKLISQKGKRQLFFDGKPGKRQKMAGILKTILFEPDDLKLVKEGPEKRRRFLNQEISNFQPQYNAVLRDYEKILNQRNTLLKEIRFSPELKNTLNIWNEQLIQMGSRLMLYRIRYLHRLHREANQLHHYLSDGREDLALYYQNNVIESLNDVEVLQTIFKKKLIAAEGEEIKKGTTLFGPHLDDMLIEINKKEARRYASQGQQRSVAIALKLSQINICYESIGAYPVVLLDDIFSELDEKRRKSILLLLDKTQAFITCTEDVLESELKNSILISRGKVLKKP